MVRAPLLICLIGAECTGKSTLAQTLARHFSGLWVPEALRTFCDARGRAPTHGEQSEILATQLAQEASAFAQARAQRHRHVFCDTSALLTAIYSEFYFSDRTLYARAHALQARYTLTLLLAPDLPWVADGLQRDGHQARSAVDTLIRQELSNRYPLTAISGTGDSRFQAAVGAVAAL